MGHQSPFSQNSGYSSIVDKALGNAYPVVKHVHDNLDSIAYLAENAGAILEAGNAVLSTIEYVATAVETLTTIEPLIEAAALAFEELDLPLGSHSVGYLSLGDGAVPTTVQAKLREFASAKDFGAKGDGETIDNAAFLNMSQAVGYIRLTAGEYKLSSLTIDVPIFFDSGASIHAVTGQTIKLTESITSSRQWIFKGNGVYELTNDSNSGENSRQVHVAWFGALPTSSSETDMEPYINKCFTSVGNLREADIEFDIGRYYVGATLAVPRACWVRGNGTRRTVFCPLTDGFSVFTTMGVGARFTGIQFELPVSFAGTYRTSPFISMKHSECDANDIWVGRATKSIVVTGVNCRLSDINATYTVAVGSGSSIILVQASNCTIRGVYAGTSAFGPDALIEIGGADALANISNVTVESVKWVIPSTGVLINATAISVVRSSIKNLAYAGITGSSIPQVIKTITGGSASVSFLSIEGVVASGLAANGILFSQGSTGYTENITIAGVVLDGNTGFGIGFVRTAGVLRVIRVGDTVDVSKRPTPIYYSGDSSNIHIAPSVIPGTNGAYCYAVNIANDSVVEINLGRSMFTGVAIITVGTSHSGLYILRAAATSPSLTPIGTPTTGLVTSAVVLTGTTGVNGQVTISAQDKMIYIENRLGSNKDVSLTVLSGTMM